MNVANKANFLPLLRTLLVLFHLYGYPLKLGWKLFCNLRYLFWNLTEIFDNLVMQ